MENLSLREDKKLALGHPTVGWRRWKVCSDCSLLRQHTLWRPPDCEWQVKEFSHDYMNDIHSKHGSALMQYVWQVCQRLKKKSINKWKVSILMQKIYNWLKEILQN